MRENWLEFLERNKGWAIALGFNNGVPHGSDVTKFVNFNEDGFELEFNVKKTNADLIRRLIFCANLQILSADG